MKNFLAGSWSYLDDRLSGGGLVLPPWRPSLIFIDSCIDSVKAHCFTSRRIVLCLQNIRKLKQWFRLWSTLSSTPRQPVWQSEIQNSPQFDSTCRKFVVVKSLVTAHNYSLPYRNSITGSCLLNWRSKSFNIPYHTITYQPLVLAWAAFLRFRILCKDMRRQGMIMSECPRNWSKNSEKLDSTFIYCTSIAIFVVVLVLWGGLRYP